MSNFFNFFGSLISVVFEDLTNPFSLIFCGFIFLGFLILIIKLLFGGK